MAKSSEGRRDRKIPGLPLRLSGIGNPMKWPDLHNDPFSPKIQRTLHCAPQIRSWFENTSLRHTLSYDQNSFSSSPQAYNPISTIRILNLQQKIPNSQTPKKTQDAHQAPKRAIPRSISRSQSQQRDPIQHQPAGTGHTACILPRQQRPLRNPNARDPRNCLPQPPKPHATVRRARRHPTATLRSARAGILEPLHHHQSLPRPRHRLLQRSTPQQPHLRLETALGLHFRHPSLTFLFRCDEGDGRGRPSEHHAPRLQPPLLGRSQGPMDVHVGDGVARDVPRVRRGAGRETGMEDGHQRDFWAEDGSRARVGAQRLFGAMGDCACGGGWHGVGSVRRTEGSKEGRNGRRRKRAKSWGDDRWERVDFSQRKRRLSGKRETSMMLFAISLRITKTLAFRSCASKQALRELTGQVVRFDRFLSFNEDQTDQGKTDSKESRGTSKRLLHTALLHNEIRNISYTAAVQRLSGQNDRTQLAFPNLHTIRTPPPPWQHQQPKRCAPSSNSLLELPYLSSNQNNPARKPSPAFHTVQTPFHSLHPTTIPSFLAPVPVFKNDRNTQKAASRTLSPPSHKPHCSDINPIRSVVPANR